MLKYLQILLYVVAGLFLVGLVGALVVGSKAIVGLGLMGIVFYCFGTLLGEEY